MDLFCSFLFSVFPIGIIARRWCGVFWNRITITINNMHSSTTISRLKNENLTKIKLTVYNNYYTYDQMNAIILRSYIHCGYLSHWIVKNIVDRNKCCVSFLLLDSRSWLKQLVFWIVIFKWIASSDGTYEAQKCCFSLFWTRMNYWILIWVNLNHCILITNAFVPENGCRT